MFFTTSLDDCLTDEETEARKGQAGLGSVVELGFCPRSVFPPDHGTYKEWDTLDGRVEVCLPGKVAFLL